MRRRSRRGFTLLELLVVIGIIALLLAIAVPVSGRIRRSGNQVKCLNNLRQLVTGFVTYAADNRGLLPDPRASQASWESMLAEKVPHREIYRCPSDEELFPTIGSSYDWRDTGDPQSSLAGHNLTTAPPLAVLTFESLPGWHAGRQMNAAFVDGSARALPDRDCLENLSRPITDDLSKPIRAGGR